MESVEFHHAAALLAWQIELGADEALCDAPVNRYDLPATLNRPDKAARPPAPAAQTQMSTLQKAAQSQETARLEAVEVAAALAAGAMDPEALGRAVQGFQHCELKRGARSTLFGAGVAGAQVMIIADAPSRNDDRAAVFFDGAQGRLIDRMFAAIDLERSGEAASVYTSFVMPWRPPQDRSLKAEELAMMKPFVERHIALVDPAVLVLMGNAACQMLLGKRGLTRLRGDWITLHGKPARVMMPPEYLMQNPLAKRDAWADLLEIKARLQQEKGTAS